MEATDINNVTQANESVKQEIEELKALAELIRATINKEKQNEARLRLAEKLYRIKKEGKYKLYGYKNFHTFAEETTGLNWRTIRYMLEAYEFTKSRPELFIRYGYRKINVLSKVYESAEDIPEEENRSISEIEKGTLRLENMEADKGRLTKVVKEFARKYGMEELKDTLKRAIQQLKEEGVI